MPLQVCSRRARSPLAESLFHWTAPSGAAVKNYRFSATRTSGPAQSGRATSVGSIATFAEHYAPTAMLAEGSWSWSVAALDAGGKVLGTTAGTFVVDGTPRGEVQIEADPARWGPSFRVHR